MDRLKKIIGTNRNIVPGLTPEKNIYVKAGDFNPVVDAVNALALDAMTITGVKTFSDGIVATNIKMADGSAASPAIYGTTSSGAGIHFGSNIVSIDTAGTERVNVDAQGDININGGRGIEGGTTGVGTYWAQFSPIAVQQDLSGPGAITLTEYYTAFTSTGTGDALTLANGKIIGQVKKVKYVAEGAGADTGVITLTGYTTITLNAIADYVKLMWNGTAWVCIENFGATIV